MGSKKHILVLEDERPLQEAIRIKLEHEGFAVLTARSVDEAFEELEGEDAVDIIWLDHYLLGKSSGLDFVAKIKHDDNPYRKVPVYVVSNTASAGKVQSYLKLGIQKYYTKSEHRLDEIIGDIRKELESSSEE